MERHVDRAAEVTPGRNYGNVKGSVVFLCIVIVVHKNVVG